MRCPPREASCGLLVPDAALQERALLPPPTCARSEPAAAGSDSYPRPPAGCVAAGNTSWCQLRPFPIALVGQEKSCPTCAVTCLDLSDTGAFVVKDLSCSDQPKGVSRHTMAVSVCLASLLVNFLLQIARAGRASWGVRNEVIGSRHCQLHQGSGFPQPEGFSLVLQLKMLPPTLCEVHSELLCSPQLSPPERWKRKGLITLAWPRQRPDSASAPARVGGPGLPRSVGSAKMGPQAGLRVGQLTSTGS